MDGLIFDKKAKPMIVVMTNGNANQQMAPGFGPLPRVQGAAPAPGLLALAARLLVPPAHPLPLLVPLPGARLEPAALRPAQLLALPVPLPAAAARACSAGCSRRAS